MKKIKAVFFDRDQTLTTWNPDKKRLLIDYIHKHCQRPYDLPNQTMMDLFQKAGYPDGGLKTLDAEKAFWLRYYAELLIHFGAKDSISEGSDYLFSELWCNGDRVLFEEVIEVLDYFKNEGLQIGVISDTSPSLQLSLEQLGLGKWIDSYTCSDLVGVMKPDPQIFNAALRTLDVQADEALYVDDYDVESDGARMVGFTAFHIDRSGKTSGEWVIRSLRDMVTYYERIKQVVTKGLCPICGQPNGCAVIANRDPASCWCMTTKVPEGLLEQIPNHLRKQSCVCENCVEEARKKGIL